ncbi:hypothetical protein [Eisenibacter elegans]|uniref:hypothetical protein n=1 Tax=Eisenibacter elegans TaxID=997 RepID=UPI00041B079D|nr:hypothetical protein [Eisenibacter elegans]
MPYARAERFQALEPVAPSPSPILAQQWAAACPQAGVPFLEKVLGSPPLAKMSTVKSCLSPFPEPTVLPRCL